LKKAKEVLDVMSLPEKKRLAYEWHLEEMRYQTSMDHSRFTDGRLEGEKRGMEKGIEMGMEKGVREGKIAMAKLMKQAGEPMEKIAKYAQLTPEEIGDL